MSATKKQKIEEEKEDAGEAIRSLNDLLSKQVGQQVERSVKHLLAQQEQALVRTQEALKQNQKALHAAMQIVNDTIEGRYHWGTLSVDIRNDPNCVIQAIQDEKVHLTSSDIPQELLRNDRQVALEACKAGLYKEFSPTQDEWRDNEALSRVALDKGLIKNMADAPMLTTQEVVDSLKNKKVGWENIPEDLKADENFCRRIVAFQERGFVGYPLAALVFERWPRLREDRQVWEEIFSSSFSFVGLTDLLLSEPLPPAFCADVTFMQQAYDREPSALEVADPIELEQFIQNKILEKPTSLAFCPREFPGQSLEFVEAQLAKFSSSLQEHQWYLVDKFVEKIPGRILEDTSFTDSWFQAGLPMTRNHPEPFRANRDIFLRVAEHGSHWKWKLDSLHMAEAELLDDVSFITDVMKHEPSLFEVASEQIRKNNFELAMAALSQPLFVTRCRDAIAARRSGPFSGIPLPPSLSAETLCALRIRAESDLMLYNNFVKLFLCGLCFVGHDTIHHQKMSQLDGSQEIKMLIGEFVGYPRSRVLRNNMQAALENLAESRDGNVEAND